MWVAKVAAFFYSACTRARVWKQSGESLLPLLPRTYRGRSAYIFEVAGGCNGVATRNGEEDRKRTCTLSCPSPLDSQFPTLQTSAIS
jgi:hypothetical protein